MESGRTGILWSLALCLCVSAFGQEKEDNRLRLFFELRGGSKVSGLTDLVTLPVQTSYARMDMKIGIIDGVEFADGPGGALLVLRNGDRLRGDIVMEKIPIAAAFGATEIAVKQIMRMSVLPAGACPGLLLWNRLDGGRSMVGPDVEALNIAEYCEGKSGRGAQVAGNNVYGFRVPAAILKEAKKGTVEFWMKVVRKAPTVTHGSGPIYDFIVGGVHAQYNANDGNGHGKYSIQSASYFVYTEGYSGSKSTDLLGKEGEWNHYGIAWDSAGIEGMNGAKLAFLINGRPHGTYQAGPPDAFPLLAGANADHVMFHRNRNGFEGTMVYDELKIWDHAVTDFSRSHRMVPAGVVNGARRVGIDLVDGSHVRGTLVTEKFELTTKDLGRISVPKEHIADLSIAEDRETGTLALTAGDELVGVIGTPVLAMKTVFGDVEIKTTHVSGMTVVD